MAVRESDRGSGLDVLTRGRFTVNRILCLPADMQRTNTRENSSPSWIFAGMLFAGLEQPFIEPHLQSVMPQRSAVLRTGSLSAELWIRCGIEPL